MVLEKRRQVAMSSGKGAAVGAISGSFLLGSKGAAIGGAVGGLIGAKVGETMNSSGEEEEAQEEA